MPNGKRHRGQRSAERRRERVLQHRRPCQSTRDGADRIRSTLCTRGPIAGLEAAWRTRPEAAWLALAIDMPLADRPLLQFLIDYRNADALATAFLHEDGTIEPLCAIWEPAARQPLLEQVRRGDASLRRFLSRGNVECLVCPTPEKLRNANDIAAYRELLDGLGT